MLGCYKMSSTPSKTNVALYVRILPEANTRLDHVRFADDGYVYVRCWQDFAKGKETQVPNYMLFATNGIFHNISQEEIFDRISEDEIFEKLIYGNNGLVLSYGQTGSGKSLTTTGLHSTYADRGTLPRALERLFALKADQSDKYKISIKLRYVETNRNYMMDLLSNDETLYDMNTYKKIKPTKVRDLHEGLRLLFKGEARKTVRRSACYNSNLANSIATISVFTKGQNTAVSEGTLHVVDLAGIDTIGNPTCAHKSGFEVGTGNLVKSQIDQLLLLINSNLTKDAEVKRRLCVSTHYLRNAMNNTSLVRIIAHIRAQREDLKIGTSILRMGCSFKGMVPKKLSRFLETSIDVQYQVVSDELSALKKEMDLNSMLCNEDLSHNLTDDRLEYIKQLTMEYLNGDQSELVLLSTTDTVTIMKVIKRVYQTLLEEHASPSGIQLSKNSSSGTTPAQPAQTKKGPQRISAKVSTASVDRETRPSKPKGSGLVKLLSTQAPNENRSTNSIRSKQPSRTGKKKARSTVEINPNSMPMVIVERKLPGAVPSFSDAWTMFKMDTRSKFNDLHAAQAAFETELEELTQAYNKEVLILEEFKNIASARKSDLNHAAVIRDIEAHPSTLNDLREFQAHCVKLAAQADQNVVTQKEKLLRLQAEMRLNIQYRGKVLEKLNHMYDDYCMEKFGVRVPDITVDEKPGDNLAVSTSMEFAPIIEEPPRMSSVNKNSAMMSPTDSLRAECRSIAQFTDLQMYMRREISRIAKLRVQNQRWMMSFDVRPSTKAQIKYN